MNAPFNLALSPELLEQIAARAAEIVIERTAPVSPWMTRAEAAAYLSLPVSRLEKDKDPVPP